MSNHSSGSEDRKADNINTVNNLSLFAWDFPRVDTDSPKYWEFSRSWENQSSGHTKEKLSYKC